MSNGGSKRISRVSSCRQETESFGEEIATRLSPNGSLCLFGELGTGKTTLVKSVAFHLSGFDPDEVVSPTFTYLNIYEGRVPIYHFDLYRLEGIKDFLNRGFDEYFDLEGICCIEWAERIAPILPPHALKVHIKHLEECKRELVLE